MPRYPIAIALSTSCARRPQWRQISLQATAQLQIENVHRDSSKEKQRELKDLLILVDQQKNNEARVETQRLRNINWEANEFVSSMPTEVQVLSELPAFVNGEAKRIRQKCIATGENLDEGAANILLHLRDLKREAYKDHDHNPLAQFDMEIAEMSEDERRKKYNQLERDRLAADSRSSDSAQALQKLVEDRVVEGGGTVVKRSLGMVGSESDDIDMELEDSYELNGEMVEDDDTGEEDQFADGKSTDQRKRSDMSKKPKQNTEKTHDNEKPLTSGLFARHAELMQGTTGGKK